MSSNPSSGVSAIKSNLKDLTQQIKTLQKQLVEEALNNLLNKEAERDGGSADIEFVKTIPSKGLDCKKGESIQILHPFHVDFPEGCVTVLMGPSGAGSKCNHDRIHVTKHINELPCNVCVCVCLGTS